MTEEERQKQIKFTESKLSSLIERRDELQKSLCTVISNIHQTRQQLKNLGYQSPTASGA